MVRGLCLQPLAAPVPGAWGPGPPARARTGVRDLPFPATTWGMLERLASAQMELGDEAGAYKTLALIPADETDQEPVYRSGRAKAYNVLLMETLRRHLPDPHRRRE